MMHFLQQFTLFDVFMVGLGLVIATLLRIYYDSYKERKYLQELDNKVRVYNQSIDAYEEGVLILSQDNEVLFANKEFGDFFGVEDHEITRDFLSRIKLVYINNPAKEMNFLDAVDRRKYISDVKVAGMVHAAPLKISSNLFRGNEDPDTYWHVIVMNDLSEYYRLQQQIQKNQSYNDLLTDLPILGRLMGDLVDANIRSNIQDRIFTLVFFGIKHFGNQRSTLGYEKTNHIIRVVADTLKDELHEDEKLYYRGRGDFALLLSENSDTKLDERRVRELLNRVNNLVQKRGIDVDFSTAILHLDHDKRTPDAIIDDCLEMQLESERTGQVVIESSLSEKESASLGMLNLHKEEQKFTKTDFANAIQRKEFFSFYQPIFEIRSGRLIGAEYLMRWNHPKYGLLNAADFLDKAVKLNVLTEITDYLLENVLSHKSSWDSFGIEDFNLSINLAMSELRVANFAEKLEQKLYEHTINPKTITIDLSEKLLGEDIRLLQNEVETLKKVGVKIAMDSFGEGFTHLKFLEELPFDTIKIDKSLIHGIEKSNDKRKLVAAIIAMGKGLGVSVGATYIDTEETYNTLRELGCDYGQGYFYSKALPFFEMLNFIQGYRKKGLNHPSRIGA